MNIHAGGQRSAPIDYEHSCVGAALRVLRTIASYPNTFTSFYFIAVGPTFSKNGRGSKR